MAAPPRRQRHSAPRFPFAAELMYRKAALALLRDLREVVLAELADTGPMLVLQAEAYRPDAVEYEEAQSASVILQAWAATLEGMLSRIGDRIAVFVRQATVAVFNAGRYAEAVNKTEWRRVVREAWGVDVLRGEPRLPELMAAWENQNLALIKSLPDNVVAQLRGLMTDALTRGTDLRELRRIVIDRTDAAVPRAELIARDQIGKLNASLGEYRQRNAGIKSYVWRTMADERVRPTHRERDGKTYNWNDTGIKPGSEIRCRCVADPVFPDIGEVEIVVP